MHTGSNRVAGYALIATSSNRIQEDTNTYNHLDPGRKLLIWSSVLPQSNKKLGWSINIQDTPNP